MVLRTSKGREAEARVLATIDELWTEKGYAPTVREIAERMGTAHSGVHTYIRNLVEAGLVHGEPNIARSLRLSATGRTRLSRQRRTERRLAGTAH